MNILRSWKRIMAIGCSHGDLIDPLARSAILKFAANYKPTIRFHLGDWCDTAALRAGAKGSKDEGEDITPDIKSGLKFLEDYRATHVTMGNHDERPYRFLESPNARERELAEYLVAGIEAKMKALKINWINSWNVHSYIKMFGFKWMHGYMYNENVARDHAEAHGNVVFAHAHTTMMQKGRRDDNPTGYCVGTLTRIRNMDYAKNRRKTLSWSQGFVWGEGCGNECYLWIHQNGQNEQERPWRLPT